MAPGGLRSQGAKGLSALVLLAFVPLVLSATRPFRGINSVDGDPPPYGAGYALATVGSGLVQYGGNVQTSAVNTLDYFLPASKLWSDLGIGPEQAGTIMSGTWLTPPSKTWVRLIGVGSYAVLAYLGHEETDVLQVQIRDVVAGSGASWIDMGPSGTSSGSVPNLALMRPGMTSIGSKMYMFGGFVRHNNTLFDDNQIMWILDTLTFSWTHIQPTTSTPTPAHSVTPWVPKVSVIWIHDIPNPWDGDGPGAFDSLVFHDEMLYYTDTSDIWTFDTSTSEWSLPLLNKTGSVQDLEDTGLLQSCGGKLWYITKTLSISEVSIDSDVRIGVAHEVETQIPEWWTMIREADFQPYSACVQDKMYMIIVRAEESLGKVPRIVFDTTTHKFSVFQHYEYNTLEYWEYPYSIDWKDDSYVYLLRYGEFSRPYIEGQQWDGNITNKLVSRATICRTQFAMYGPPDTSTGAPGPECMEAKLENNPYDTNEIIVNPFDELKGKVLVSNGRIITCAYLELTCKNVDDGVGFNVTRCTHGKPKIIEISTDAWTSGQGFIVHDVDCVSWGNFGGQILVFNNDGDALSSPTSTPGTLTWTKRTGLPKHPDGTEKIVGRSWTQCYDEDPDSPTLVVLPETIRGEGNSPAKYDYTSNSLIPFDKGEWFTPMVGNNRRQLEKAWITKGKVYLIFYQTGADSYYTQADTTEYCELVLETETYTDLTEYFGQRINTALNCWADCAGEILRVGVDTFYLTAANSIDNSGLGQGDGPTTYMIGLRNVPRPMEVESSGDLSYDLFSLFDGDVLQVTGTVIMSQPMRFGSTIGKPSNVLIKGSSSASSRGAKGSRGPDDPSLRQAPAGPRILVQDGAFFICAALNDCSGITLEGLELDCSARTGTNPTLMQFQGSTVTGSASHVTFRNCMASGTGGGFGGTLASFDANLEISNTHFISSSSVAYGGAIAVQGGHLTIKDSEFDSCMVSGVTSEAGFGGAIAGLPIVEREITTGGILEKERRPEITIHDTKFVGNSASKDGGVLWVRDVGRLHLQNCNFETNSATSGNGGAVSVLVDGGVTNISASTFTGNSAEAGGALFMEKAMGAVLEGITFNNNQAARGGGALMWVETAPNISDPQPCGPSGNANTAAYGACIASSAMKIAVDISSDSTFYTGRPIVPPISIHLMDFYDQIVATESGSTVEIKTSLNGAYADDGSVQLSGPRFNNLESGVATFPGVTVEMTVDTVDTVNMETTVNNMPQIYFESADADILYTGATVRSPVIQLPMGLNEMVCPQGYVLQRDEGNVGTCTFCELGTYSFQPLQSPEGVGAEPKCFNCPVQTGSSCEGEVANVTRGSWSVVDGALRLQNCGIGFVLVKGSDTTPENDQCVQCINGYSIDEGVFPQVGDGPVMWVNDSNVAQTECVPCHDSDVASCDEGFKVIPQENYWYPPPDWRLAQQPLTFRPPALGDSIELLEDKKTRIRMYKCPPNSCGPNWQCEDGHEPGSVVCGVCEEGWAITPSGCSDCRDMDLGAGKALAGVFGFLIFVFLWYWFTWKDLLQDIGVFAGFNNLVGQATSCYISAQEQQGMIAEKAGCITGWISWIGEQFNKFKKDMQGFLKILISFYQVVSSFATTFKVEWPEKISSVYRGTKIFQLDFLAIPGPTCLTHDWSYWDKLFAYTFTPMVVVPLIAVPAFCVQLLGKREFGDATGHPRYEGCMAQFWYAILFFLYLIYPMVSVQTLTSFNCQDLDSSGSWLRADYREICPNERTGERIFGWSLFCVFIYPVGIPFFMCVVMWLFKVPTMAQQKIEIVQLLAMINTWRHENVTQEGSNLLLHIQKIAAEFDEFDSAKICTKKVIETLYNRIDENGDKEISMEEVANYMAAEGLADDASQSNILTNMVQKSLKKRKGRKGLRFNEFLEFCQRLEYQINLFSGTDIPRSMPVGVMPVTKLTNEQLKELANYEWNMNEGGGFDTSQDNLLATMAEGQPSDAEEEEEEPEAAEEEEELTRPELKQKVMEKVEELQSFGVITLPAMGWDGALEGEQEVIDKIGFLFTMYEVKFWYFEAIEMIRKLLMTSVLVFIATGTPAQLAAGIVISFGSLLIYYSMRPFMSDALDSLQLYSICVQLINLFYGILLIIQEEAQDPGMEDSPFLDMLVVLLNSLVVAVPFVNAAMDKGISTSTVAAVLQPVCKGKEVVEEEDPATQIKKPKRPAKQPTPKPEMKTANLSTLEPPETKAPQPLKGSGGVDPSEIEPEVEAIGPRPSALIPEPLGD